MTLVVSEASPLIALQQIGAVRLLKGLSGGGVIPPAVAEEVAPSVPLPSWIEPRPLQQAVVVEVLHASSSPGESEAISLARELHTDWLGSARKKRSPWDRVSGACVTGRRCHAPRGRSRSGTRQGSMECRPDCHWGTAIAVIPG